MAPSIIYFVKKGSQVTLTNHKTIKAKTSYLHVGYVRRNVEKVYYQPADDTANGPSMPANFVWEGGSKRKTNRPPPKEGEIAWLIHFDPKLIQNNNKKERDDMHKQTLYNAWRFLEEDDRDEVERLKAELTEPHDRLWDSWFQEAVAWKDARVRRRARRVRGLIRSGQSEEQAAEDAHSDSSDDSAVDVDDDDIRNDGFNHMPMGPPPLPLQRSTQRSSRRGPGSSRPGSDRSSKRARHDSPLSDIDSGNSDLSDLGHARARPRRARARPSRFTGLVGPFGEEPYGDDNHHDIFMHGANDGNLAGALLRNRGLNGAGSLESSPDIIGRPGRTPSVSVDYDTRPPQEGNPRVLLAEEHWVDTDNYQNGDDQEASLEEAIRQSSVAPEGPSQNTAMAAAGLDLSALQGEIDEDTAFQRAVTESLENPGRSPSPPPTLQPTVEDVDGEE